MPLQRDLRITMVPMSRNLLLVSLLTALTGGFALAQQEPEESPEERTVRRVGEGAGEEYRIDLAIPEAADNLSTQGGTLALTDPGQDARLQQLLGRLAARPGDPDTLAGLDALLDELLVTAEGLLDAGSLEQAAELLSVVRRVNPAKPGLDGAEQRLDGQRTAGTALEQARLAMAEGRLLEPAGDNALQYYHTALEAEPGNLLAQEGMAGVQQAVLDMALDAAENLDFESAQAWLQDAAEIGASGEDIGAMRAEIAAFRERKASEIEQDVVRAIQRGDFDLAEFTLIDLIALGDHEPRVAELRARIERERIYGQFHPGDVIQDVLASSGGTAPAVVVVASGSFLMGSPADERGRSENEGPQHRVTIGRGFGLGMQEVTVGQFRSFVEATAYRTVAERDGQSIVWDEAMGRLGERQRVNWRHDFEGKPAAASLPVLHVAWDDAQAYLAWLSRETGVRYRLPSEAEFEYALRAGSVSPYWWGEGRPDEVIENLTGEKDVSATGRNWGTFIRGYGDGHWGPAPAGSFKANPFGLFDMAGNASEWVQDCWHANYLRAPDDGSAWENPGCERHVVRGGYWASAPEQSRSAARLSAGRNLHDPRVGFRVARDL